MTSGISSTDVQSRARYLIRGGVLLAVFSSAVALLGMAECEESSTVPEERAWVADWATAELLSGYRLEQRHLGRVESRRRSVMSFDRNDTVIRVNVEEGESVEAGQSLALLDTRELLASRAQLRAELRASEARLEEFVAGPREEDIAAALAEAERARSDLELARATEERLRKALTTRAVSEQVYDEGRLAAASADARYRAAAARHRRLQNGSRAEDIAVQRAQVESVRARLEQNDIELSHSELTAPFAALIVRRNVDEGTRVTPGQPVLELLERSALEIRVGLPQDDIDRLQVGTAYPLLVAGRRAEGIFRRRIDTRHRGSRTLDAVFEWPGNSTFTPRDGDLATLILEKHVERSGAWIPTAALTQSLRGLWACYVIAGDSRLERRELQVLHLEGDRAYVCGSLSTGDRVVSAGVQRFAVGQQVVLEDASGGSEGTRVATRGEGSN